MTAPSAMTGNTKNQLFSEAILFISSPPWNPPDLAVTPFYGRSGTPDDCPKIGPSYQCKPAGGLGTPRRSGYTTTAWAPQECEAQVPGPVARPVPVLPSASPSAACGAASGRTPPASLPSDHTASEFRCAGAWPAPGLPTWPSPSPGSPAGPGP